MKAYLQQLLADVLADMDGVPADFDIEFQKPANADHGDLATNAALQLARPLRRNPRQIAQALVDALQARVDADRIEGVDIAGPGFINFRFSDRYLTRELARILDADVDFGRTDLGTEQSAIVEYVSANPTGPLTVGHGRNAVLGDTFANLLDWAGYDVTREYYFNDAGRQMRVLGQSVRARYEEQVDPQGAKKTIDGGGGETVEVPAGFPEDGYLGEYISDIARELYTTHGDALMEAEDETPFKEAAERAIFRDIEGTMQRIGIPIGEGGMAYFNEHALYTDNAVWDTLDALREKGYVYDKDGAVWFKTTAFGKDKDTVLVKSTGEPTYRLPDIAYHVNKLERGFDKIVDIFGADHIATYPDVISGVEALGYDAAKIDVVIYQFVTLVRGGEPVKMSTRKANFVTLDDLMDEVGADVTRFFFLMRSPNTHLDFDLDLAKEAREKNPVFYLQYAHARICSIVRKAEDVGFSFADERHLGQLEHETELALIKDLVRFPEMVQKTALSFEPQRLITYLNEVATAFTRFYDACRIVGEPREIATARMNLARATQTVLRNGLTILGITAPEKM